MSDVGDNHRCISDYYVQPWPQYPSQPFPGTLPSMPSVSLPWVCPKCQRVYGPDAQECFPCNDKITKLETP